MQSRNGSSFRPKSSLSEHVAREFQRDFTVRPASRRHQRQGAINSSARGIKRFVFATAGGVKRVSVATGKRSAEVGGTLKRSVTNLTKKAYNNQRIPNCMSRFGPPLDSRWSTSVHCLSSNYFGRILSSCTTKSLLYNNTNRDNHAKYKSCILN